MTTVLDCLESGTRYLEKRGIEDARRNMQWLVARELGCSRMELYTQFDRPLTEGELTPLREFLKRRGAGEPLQHLLGTTEFCRHEFRCDGRALIPRPETEELVERILEHSLNRPLRLLDMGTGSGVLGISLALALGETCTEAVLADRSAEALALATENASLLGCDVTVVQSDLFASITGRFDLIAANLPYVAEADRESLSAEVGHDPPEALFAGPDGLEVLRRFIPGLPEALHPGGLVALEVGAEQTGDVAALLEQSGLADIRRCEDLSGNPRFVFARASDS